MKRGRRHNPFSVQFLGPENIEYHFAEGDSLEALLTRLDVARWRASFVGPHGAGKSTLLRTVRRVAHERGRRTILFQCNDHRRWLPIDWIFVVMGAEIVFLDGGEQLIAPQLHLLQALCRIAGKGLLQTTHVVGTWGDQIAVSASAAQLHSVIERVAAPKGVLVDLEEAAKCLQEAGGDAREALFALYREYEDGLLRQAFPLNNPRRSGIKNTLHATSGARHDAG